MSYTFLRWYRQGMAAALDASMLSPAQGLRVSLPVTVDISASGIANQNANVTVQVLGPGDVNGVDNRQVVRTFPVTGTLDFEPGYFAHVEFRRPDLPWIFSPVAPVAAADTTPLNWTNPPYRRQHTVIPWLCLVVVPKRDGITLKPATPLPRLTIADGAGAELPLLEEAHAWAHVQVSGSLTTGVNAIAGTEPNRLVSRLVCPRRLLPDERYLACVVPVFKSGRQAGLGETANVAKPDELAWSSTDVQIELPVYFHWEFATGAEGDFEALVRRLTPLSTIPGAGTRPLDITTPSFGLTDRGATTTVPLGGALSVTPPAAAPVDVPFATDAATIINATDAVAPPIYGRWHARVETVVPPAGGPGWVEALNLDPRHRVAAGLGTRVVQDRQEDLMAAIWRQFGEIRRANQLLAQAQLAVAATDRVLARHLLPLADVELIALTAPAAGRIRVAPHRTIRKTIRESCLPLVAVSGAFRRVLRGRGPIARRFGRALRTSIPDVPTLPPVGLSARAVLEQLAAGNYRLGSPLPPDGAIVAPFEMGFGRRRPVRPIRGATGPQLPADLQGALQMLARRVPTGQCRALDTAALADSICTALIPRDAIGARIRAQITPPAGVQISPRLDPIMVAPEIPTPMIGPLQDLGPDWLLPGLSEMPRNSVVLVEPDAAFIEAYMVGLNHEMSRELLWRGFPTDQRGTVFSRFWDRRGTVSTSVAPVPERDIDPIHTWGVRDSLGAHLKSNRSFLVLLIRGDLLQRYPLATIYMHRAQWKRDRFGDIVMDDGVAVREPVPLPNDRAAWDTDVRWPLFTGSLGGDITFLGFPLSRQQVRGSSRRGRVPSPITRNTAGWYVVFQEQPTEPRFGLGEAPGVAVTSWDQIGWPNVTTTEADAGYVKLAETSTVQGFADLPVQPTWDGRSDSLAAIFQKRAFRLYVHGSDLVTSS